MVFNLLEDAGHNGIQYPEWLLDICQWLYGRGNDVLKELLDLDPPFNEETTENVVQGAWQTVGAFSIVALLC